MSLTTNSVRFGAFEADLRSGELRKNGLKLKLSEQPFHLLTILLHHPGQVVEREELRQQLWPDTFVDFEHGINAAVKRLREVLDDSADNPRFIETLPRHGYRFICPVESLGTASLHELKEESDSGVLAAGASAARRNGGRLAWTTGMLLLAAALGLGGWFALIRRSAPAPVSKVSAFTALPGMQTDPALSADGKQVAFVWNGPNRDNYDIYVQLVGDTTPRRLTSSPAFEHSPVWSPDGLHIAFLRETPAAAEVVVVPSGGGVEKRLLASTAWCDGMLARQFCGLAWSPDGKFLTVVDKESPQSPNSIFLFDLATLEKRKLITPPEGFEDGLSVFSPDGRSLAFARRHGFPLSDIYVLPLSGGGQPRGEPQPITRDNKFIWGMDWSGDSRSIVFASSRGGLYGLWRVASTGGTPERLHVGSNDAFWPSVSRKGDRLAYSYGNTDMHIWRVAAPGSGATAAAAAPMRITHSPQWDQDPVFSPDGAKVAWSSTHTGSHQIWVAASDGALAAQLTYLDAPGADAPQWSPDGRQIAFRGFSPWPTGIYVIRSEGGAPRRLTTGDFGVSPPSWSRDGKWVYFASDHGEGWAVWKVPAGGGPAVLVARQGWWPVESLDSKDVYYAGLKGGIWKAPAGGGAPVRIARKGSPPIVESFNGRFVYYSGPDASIWKVHASGGEGAPVLKTGKRASWAATAAGIYALNPDATGGPAIEFAPFAGKRPETLRLPGEPGSYAAWISGEVWGLAASPDGRWLSYQYRDRTEAQIMLVENFR